MTILVRLRETPDGQVSESYHDLPSLPRTGDLVYFYYNGEAYNYEVRRVWHSLEEGIPDLLVVDAVRVTVEATEQLIYRSPNGFS